MKNITTFLLKDHLEDFKDAIEFISYNPDTFIKDLKNAKGKYINFIKDIDHTSNNYFETILKTTQTEFDVCFINYTVEIDGKVMATEKLETPEIQKRPYVGDYIWTYIWRKEKLLELLNSEDKSNEAIDKMFQYVNYIEEPIYHHKPSERMVFDFIYTDEKEEVRRKNVFYLGSFCNGQFNGYITWLKNIGRCFGKDYPLTILYDKIYEPTKKAFEKYFEVIERKENVNYICDRLLVTYSTYYYAKNILTKEENYLFIHGIMSDYEHSRRYKYDNYTKYIGVSEISAKKAKGYYPTEQFDHILNPIKIDKRDVKPHLKLVSAQRCDPIKKGERIHQISQILDEEEIPYTWNIFTDKSPYDDNIYGGVIYRKPIQNTLPYIKDADYYVQLSDSEACSYSVLEALALNTKVIVTPLDCYEEMKIDETQGYIIPFEIFEPEHKEKLREIVLDIYKNKNRKMQNKLTEDMYEGYKDLFKK